MLKNGFYKLFLPKSTLFTISDFSNVEIKVLIYIDFL